ncbi:MAG: methyltransferase domain-containing protein, partial [Stellaceae bacterium]
MIICWSRGVAAENMDEDILVELRDLVARHPWWTARARLFLSLLGGIGYRSPCQIIEAGCGWGTNLAALEKAGYIMTGLDVSRSALARLDRLGRTLIEADLSKDLPPNTPEYDVALAPDVIEHIDDDRGAVRRLAQLTKPGGHVIISVPALPELFSQFDQVQGHRRRYTPESLRNVIAAGGLEIVQILWWGQWMIPLLATRRANTRALSSVQVYKRQLSLPPWPGVWFLRLMFLVDHGRTLQGRNVKGT